MGHAVYPPEGCYSDPWRPYSPMLFGALGDDYSLPAYLNPMSTFQMGMGSGSGIGVPPENHPSSWFAAISGRKRWVLNPPSAGTGRSGGYGTVRMCVCAYVRMCVCAYVRMCICAYVRMYVCAQAGEHIRTSVVR